MRVSFNQLKKYVDLTNITPDELNVLLSAKIIEVDEYFPLTPSTNLVIAKTLTKMKHPNADKLNVLTVDVGTKTVQIVCGADNVDAKQTVIVSLPGANLKGLEIKKTTIRDIESHGMICAIDEIAQLNKAMIPERSKDSILVLSDELKIGLDPLKATNLEDYIYELGITPNRSDLLSIQGIARDVACALNLAYKEPLRNDFANQTNPIIFDQIDSKLALYYSMSVVYDVEYHSNLENELFLMTHEIKPQTNIIDLSNITMLETGQPVHFFDYDKIKNKKIGVRNAKKDEKIILLDQKEYSLDENDIVITANDQAIALAGVMGDLEHSVTNETKNVAIEVAVFEPITIRRTANKYNLRTNSSNRYEKQISYASTANAKIWLSLAFSKNAKLMTTWQEFKPLEIKQTNLDIKLDQLNSFLGINIDILKLEQILTNLGFEILDNSNMQLLVKTPLCRTDISIIQDVYEEVIRMIGFDQIQDIKDQNICQIQTSSQLSFIKHIRTNLITQGFNETKTYLLGEDTNNDFGLLIDQGIHLEVDNYQSNKHRYIIKSNIHNLLDVAKYNFNRGEQNINIFEIRNVFSSKHHQGIKTLTILMSGEFITTPAINEIISANFYLLKGIIIKLLNEINLTKISIEQTNIELIKGLNPYQGGYLKVNNTIVGYLGKVMPGIKVKKDVFIAEINLDLLEKLLPNKLELTKISKFPEINRDISVLFEDNITSKEITTIIKAKGTDKLINIKTTSFFNKNEKTSLSYRLTFSSLAFTLEAKEVDVIMNDIFTELQKNNIQIPGL